MSERAPRATAALVLATLGLLAGPAAPAGAQDWRTANTSRQRAGEAALEVQVRYGAGTLEVSPAARGELYRAGLRYDADQFEPIADYADGRLRIGVEGRGRGIRGRNLDRSELKLALSPDVDLDLDLDFGAVSGEIELGGLRVRELDVETGASSSTIRFSRANPRPCRRLAVSMGAAALRLTGLGHARCAEMHVEGGVGDITLDFTGDWDGNVHLDIDMALGSATFVVPEDVGVEIERDTFLTGFDATRMRRDGSTFRSENWNQARHRLTVDLDGAFGSIRLQWADATGTATTR